MHFERRNAFQNAYNYINFSRKKICVPTLPYLKFSDPLPETQFFFIWLKGDSNPNTNMFYQKELCEP